MEFAASPVDYLSHLECKTSLTEERVDSGVGSLQEEEESLAGELRVLALSDGDPEDIWKREETEDGDTYLHLAIIHEAVEGTLQLIHQSVNDPYLNRQNKQRQTALHLAVITEQPVVVEQLLQAGCDARLVDRSGNTALHLACLRGSLTCFSILTQVHTQHLRSVLSFPNYSGYTCLHIASIYSYLSMVENLVQLGADINAKEQCSGRTSLHLAVDMQNLDLVHQLIALGADANCLTYGGHSPYHLTFGRQNSDIKQQLYERTALELRELPDSDSEEDLLPEDEDMYDDIQFRGR